MTDVLTLIFILTFPFVGLYIRYAIIKTMCVHISRSIRRDARK